MRTYPDCIPCAMQQALRAGRMATTDEHKLKEILDRTADLIKSLSLETIPASTGAKVHKIVRDVTGMDDPYKAIKQAHIDETKAIYPELERILAKSDDKLLMADRIAIAGNIIDMGVNRSFNIVNDVKAILDQDFEIADYLSFKKQLNNSNSILYIGDNAGESVFDKLLIQELKKPVKYAVRHRPIINDVTFEDAIASGIEQVAEIVDSGNESPGVILTECSPEFLEIFNTADMVISKGQGNYEGLSACNRQIFFLLKAKCNIIAHHLKVNEGAIILKDNML